MFVVYTLFRRPVIFGLTKTILLLAFRMTRWRVTCSQVNFLTSILEEMHYQFHDPSLSFGKSAPIANYVGHRIGSWKGTDTVAKGNFIYPAGYWTLRAVGSPLLQWLSYRSNWGQIQKQMRPSRSVKFCLPFKCWMFLSFHSRFCLLAVLQTSLWLLRGMLNAWNRQSDDLRIFFN